MKAIPYFLNNGIPLSPDWNPYIPGNNSWLSVKKESPLQNYLWLGDYMKEIQSPTEFMKTADNLSNIYAKLNEPQEPISIKIPNPVYTYSLAEEDVAPFFSFSAYGIQTPSYGMLGGSETKDFDDKHFDTVSISDRRSNAKEKSICEEKILVARANFLSAMLCEESFETGMSTPSEEYIIKLYDTEGKISVNNLLNKIYLDHLENTNIVLGLLHIISHFDYDIVHPQGQTMALASLSHKDDEVKEFGIKCFENWEHPDGIRILESVDVGAKWLKEYAGMVILDLKSMLKKQIRRG
jgi:hypothetical protein